MPPNKQNEEELHKRESQEILPGEESPEVLEVSQESPIESPSEEKANDLRQEIENMDLPDDKKDEVENHVKSAGAFEDDKKIEYLLEVAKNQGVVMAVKTAQKMNDPYLLDLLHDKLTEEGYYKEFKK